MAKMLDVCGYEQHGMSSTSIYKIWTGMRQRCNNPSAHNYDRYGARGTTVCDRWNLFSAFYEDMGDQPEGKSIDRIDGTKGYSPENCKWSTPYEQQINTKIRKDNNFG
ncbi:unnamed protein product, partial [marine sediment metagenome]